jgi:hypothetical protein
LTLGLGFFKIHTLLLNIGKLFMKKTFFALLCCSATLCFASDIDVVPFRDAVKAFGSHLKSELETAIKSSGHLAALGVCNLKSPLITEEHAQKLGWKMGRTSLKVRNSKNAPDQWESQILQQFEQRKTNGEDVAKLEHVETIKNADGSSVVRYMKAIPTAEPCLACHGDSLTPEVTAKIKELYPQDRATGFKLSDLRGAFTITQTMK